MVLTTLLHVDPTLDNDRRVQDSDLDVYIHGLSPKEAEKKALEIKEVRYFSVSLYLLSLPY